MRRNQHGHDRGGAVDFACFLRARSHPRAENFELKKQNWNQQYRERGGNEDVDERQSHNSPPRSCMSSSAVCARLGPPSGGIVARLAADRVPEPTNRIAAA